MKETKRRYKDMIKTAAASLLSAVLAIGAASCSDDNPKSSVPNDGWYDMVTLAAMTNAGSVFEMQKDGDSEVITYTSPYTFGKDAGLSIGDRLIIMYLCANEAPAYTSGPIDLYGYRRLDNAPQTVAAESAFAIDEWDTEPIDMQTLTRTGGYINVQARLSCYKTEGIQQWSMIADPATLGDDYPQLYIVYKAKSPGENYAKGYASWDITDIWSERSCTGITINYKSPSGIVSKTISK